MAPSQSVLPRASCQLCDFFEPTNRVRSTTRPKFKHMATGDDPSAELPKEVQLSKASLEQVIRGVTEWLRQPPATTENPTDGSSVSSLMVHSPPTTSSLLHSFMGVKIKKHKRKIGAQCQRKSLSPLVD